MAEKMVDLGEFVEFGHLQEVNRLYFHPLGMALAVTLDGEWVGDVFVRDASKPGRLEVVDWRDDPEGGIFDWEAMGEEGRAEAIQKARRVAMESAARYPIRKAALGFWAQDGPRVIGELGALVGADDPRQSLDRVAAGFPGSSTDPKGEPRG